MNKLIILAVLLVLFTYYGGKQVPSVLKGNKEIIVAIVCVVVFAVLFKGKTVEGLGPSGACDLDPDTIEELNRLCEAEEGVFPDNCNSECAPTYIDWFNGCLHQGMAESRRLRDILNDSGNPNVWADLAAFNTKCMATQESDATLYGQVQDPETVTIDQRRLNDQRLQPCVDDSEWHPYTHTGGVVDIMDCANMRADLCDDKHYNEYQSIQGVTGQEVCSATDTTIADDVTACGNVVNDGLIYGCTMDPGARDGACTYSGPRRTMMVDACQVKCESWNRPGLLPGKKKCTRP